MNCVAKEQRSLNKLNLENRRYLTNRPVMSWKIQITQQKLGRKKLARLKMKAEQSVKTITTWWSVSGLYSTCCPGLQCRGHL